MYTHMLYLFAVSLMVENEKELLYSVNDKHGKIKKFPSSDEAVRWRCIVSVAGVCEGSCEYLMLFLSILELFLGCITHFTA